MSDYLTNIVARSMSIADVVQPRLPQLFEQSVAYVPEPPSSVQVETQTGTAARSTEVAETHAVRTIRAESPMPPPRFEAVRTPSEAEPSRGEGSRRMSPDIAPPIPAFEPKETQLPWNAPDPGVIPLNLRHLTERVHPEPGNSHSVVPPREQPAIVSTEHPTSTNVAVTAVELPSRTTPASRAPVLPYLIVPSLPANDPAEQSAPTVKITIGRVDVRAIMPPVQTPASTPSRPGPALSLENYLKQRQEGKR